MRDSWITKTFDQLGDILIGGTPARNNALFWSEENTGNAWVSIADLSKAGKKITNTKESITDLGIRASNVKKIAKGSIIFSFKLSVGKKAITGRELYTNEAIAAFLFNEKLVDNDYLYYGLDSIDYSKVTDSAIKGVTLNKEKLKRLTINLPPLPQQRKIANILSTCDEVIEKTEAAIAKYQALKQGMMHDLFTRGIDVKTGKLRPSYQDATELYKESELGMIPKDWVVEPLGEENESYAGGTPNRSIEHYYKGQIPWVSSGEVNKPFIYSTKEAISEEALRFSSAKMAPKESVLIAMYGATAAQISMLKIEASTNQAVLAIIAGSCWNNYFIYYGLNFSKERILFLAQGSGQPNLNKGMIDSTLFWKPNRKEQQLIVERLSALENKLQKEQSALAKYLKLKAGLMQDLLTGKVEVSVAEEVTSN